MIVMTFHMPVICFVIGELRVRKYGFVYLLLSLSHSPSYDQCLRIRLSGMNSIGILSGGGIGRVLAHWIANGKPDVDVTGFHINRLQRYQSNPAYRAERVVESLSNVYKVHYPFKTPSSARGAKRSPFYDRLKARGANFRAVSGFETADWYDCPTSMPSVVNEDAPTDANIKRSTDVADENDDSNMLSADEIVAADRASVAADPRQSWGQPEFFPQWAREHAACREGVGLMDMSFMRQVPRPGQRRWRLSEPPLHG